MIHVKSTKRLIGILIVINVCLIALYGFLYYYVGATTQKSAVIYSEIGANQEGREAFDNLEDSVVNTESARKKLDQYFVPEDETVDFLSEIESLANVSGASVELTSVEQIEGNGAGARSGAEVLELSLQGKGVFAEVFYLANLVENLPYKITLASVSFKIARNENGQALESLEAQSAPERVERVEASNGTTSTSTIATTTASQAVPSGKTWSVLIEFTLESFEKGE